MLGMKMKEGTLYFHCLCFQFDLIAIQTSRIFSLPVFQALDFRLQAFSPIHSEAPIFSECKGCFSISFPFGEDFLPSFSGFIVKLIESGDSFGVTCYLQLNRLVYQLSVSLQPSEPFLSQQYSFVSNLFQFASNP